MAEASDKADPSAYWGYLFHHNKCPTDKLDRLLRGIAACIVQHAQDYHLLATLTNAVRQSRDIMPHDSADLKPAQLAAFYRSVGGQYDPLFCDMTAQSIACIYTSLGCLHSLQPDPSANDGPYACPSIPALKSTGFVTWQTIQLLLGPEEHVPFIQKALREFDVRDPVDGKPFPKALPREAFPLKPDQKMIEWHEGVSERLRKDMQRAVEMDSADIDVDKQANDHVRPIHGHALASSSSLALKHVSEERAQAASYFSNPFNKNKDGRPGVVRTFTKAPQRVMQGGMNVAATAGRTLKNVVDPHLWRGDGYKEHDRGSRERARDRRRKSTGDSDQSSASPLPDKDVAPRRHNTTRVQHKSRSPDRTPNGGEHYSRSPRDDRKHPPPPRSHPVRPSPRDRDAGREGRPARRHRSGSPGSSPEGPAEHRPKHYAEPSPRTSHPAPHVRRHRSQDPPSSPRDYFDDWQRNRPMQNQGNPSRPRPNSHHPPKQHQPPPEIRRTEPSFDDDGETDSTDSNLADSRPRRHSATWNPNMHFAPSVSPPMAAKVAHSRGVSGGSLQPSDVYASRPSPAEYRPIDERASGVRFAPSSTFPLSNSHGDSSSLNAANMHPHRRGSAPALSPDAEQAPPPQTETERYESRHSRESSRHHSPAGPGPPLLYGEMPPSSGSASGGNAGTASPMRSPGVGPRRVVPVEGVKGRRYAHEVPWPGGRV